MPPQAGRRLRAFLFDLDGTLLDSMPAHFRVYERVFAELGARLDEASYARHYSPNWYLFYERMHLPKARWPDADRLWLHYYAHEAPDARDGATQVLEAVKAAGRTLGLVTSGDRTRVERDLARLEWQQLFDVVVCGSDIPYRKPHPAPLLFAVEQTHVDAPDAVYVGDTVEDVQMGKRAGMATAAVAGGFASLETLRGEQPDFLFEKLTDLTALL